MRKFHALFTALVGTTVALTMVPATGCATDPENTDDAEAELGVRYGVDYSWARPSLATMRADGYTFVSRYLSHDTTGKNISAGEASALRANGFDITLNWEASQTAPLDGYSRGVADAQAASLEAISIGAPSNIPIYFSVDFDAQASQQPAIDAYFDGAAAVLGRSRVGAYGGYYLIGRLFNNGKITYGWQTYAWSYGHWDARAQVRQIHNGILAGAADLDEALVADFGQWGYVDTGPYPAAPPVPTACGAIEPGHGLSRGQGWASCDGRFWLSMQTDGNLVLYSNGIPMWATNTSNGAIVAMQTDGNFVLYSDHSHPLFNSQTSGHPGASLAIQDDGNMVVYGGPALWSTMTGGAPPAPTSCGAIEPGLGLALGEAIGSCSGRYALAMQGDGNLVLYDGGTAIWASNSVGSGTRFAVMQGDGNFVTYRANWQPVFNSHSSGHSGAFFAIQDDGNLVVYAGTTPVWNSGTAGR